MQIDLFWDNGQKKGEGGTFFPQAGHLAADTNNFSLVRGLVMMHIAIMTALVGLGHQHIDAFAQCLNWLHSKLFWCLAPCWRTGIRTLDSELQILK